MCLVCGYSFLVNVIRNNIINSIRFIYSLTEVNGMKKIPIKNPIKLSLKTFTL